MAARNLGSLTIDLIAKTGGFERGMDRASRTSRSSMRNIERNVKVAAAAIGTALVAAAGLATRAINSQFQAMDELSKAAQRAYMPTEDFSRLAYAGSLADIEIGNLTSSMGRLARAQSDAQRGLATQVEAFDKMGIAFEDANGKMRSGLDVLKDFADVVQSRQGDPEVLAAGMQIFGRSFQNLIPLLSQGRAGLEAAADEADRLGITLDTQAGKNAEAFNDNLTRMRTAVDGVWRAVATDLLPDLRDLTNEFVRATTEGDSLSTTASNIADTIRLIGNVARYTITPLLRLREIMQGVVGQAGGFGEIMRGIISRDVEQIQAGVAAYRAATAEIDNAFRSMSPGPSFGGVTGGLSSTARTAEEAAAAARDEADARTAGADAARKASERLRELMQEQQRLADAQRGWTDQLLDAQAALAGPVAEAHRQYEVQLSNLTRAYDEGEVRLSDYVQMQEVYEEQLNRTLEAIEAQRTPAERMLEDLEFERELLRLTNEEREVAIALRWANVEAASEEGKALADSVRELRQAREATSDLIEAQDAVRAAGADFLTDWTTGAKSFKDAMLDALNSIHQRITQMIAENLMDQLFGQRGQDGGGAAGNWLSGIFGAMFGGGKANGGWASANRVFEVNERGLEMATVGGRDYMLTGNQPVHVTPHEQLRGGGRSVSVTQNFINPSMIDRNSSAQREQEAAYKLRVSTARA